jgi:hypothetical protein
MGEHGDRTGVVQIGVTTFFAHAFSGVGIRRIYRENPR